MGRPKKGSVKFSFNGADWQKIRVGAGVALAGAIVAFLPETIAGVQFVVQVGDNTIDYTAFVGFAASVLINVLRKWITDHTLGR
jgi:hypothetical protein